MKNKLSKILMVIAVVIMLGATVTGSIFSIISYVAVKDDKERQKKEEDERKAKEGDFENITIAGEYDIISTKNISDAYISGDSSELNDEEKTTLEVASDLLKEIITDDMSDYEKEEAIYLWIVDNVSNETGGIVAVPEARGIVDKPYGVLQNKQAVCVGYATTFRLLTNMVGLDCMVMHDTGRGHSWNIVRLDDGCWYIVDCYFDAGNKYGRYVHFNMTEKLAYMDYDWENGLYPVANGTKYAYSEMNKTVLANANDFMSSVGEAYSAGENTKFYEFDTDSVNRSEILYIADGISSRLQSDYTYGSLTCFENSDSTFMIFYNYVDYSDMDDPWDPGVDDDFDYEKIEEKLDEIFGELSDDYWDDDYWEEGTRTDNVQG